MANPLPIPPKHPPSNSGSPYCADPECPYCKLLREAIQARLTLFGNDPSVFLAGIEAELKRKIDQGGDQSSAGRGL